jgi:hypothetical protein
MRRRRLAGLLILPAIVAVGCGGGKDIVLEPAPGTGWVSPLVETLPLRLSYVFEPSVDQEVTVRAGSTSRPLGVYYLRLGPATRAIFDRTLPLLVERARAGPPGPGDDGSLQIALLQAHATGLPEVAASVRYGITFVDPDGTARETWKIESTSTDGSAVADALERALRGATARLARSFADQPAVDRWLGDIPQGAS